MIRVISYLLGKIKQHYTYTAYRFVCRSLRRLSLTELFKIQIVLENDAFLLNYKPFSLGPWSTQQNAASRTGLGLKWKRSRLDIFVYTRFPGTRRLS